jgi:prephenate dehydrogenase
VQPSTLGIVGLGAIGGSLARQAKRAGVPTVVGWSPDPRERSEALAAGALDQAPDRPEPVAQAVQLLVLAAPPGANLALLEALLPHLPPRALVTDVGSVKRAIVARAEELGLADRFAGSHPLAGTHAHGFAASRADLFTDAVVYVTPTRNGERAARAVSEFWRTVYGARPHIVDAAVHDAEVAVTSHLPQVVASLLGGYLAHAAPPGAPLGPGARDTTRLAASEPTLWTEILLMNRDVLLPALRALEQPLDELVRALEQEDPEAVLAWLERAAVWRRRIDM